MVAIIVAVGPGGEGRTRPRAAGAPAHDRRVQGRRVQGRSRWREPGHYHGGVRTIEEQLVPEGGPRRVAQRARTAAGLPGRVVAVEDRCSALEHHVAHKIDEMRSELAEIRTLLNARNIASCETTRSA